jgi:predicted transposase YbfD/YdcC
MTKGTTTSIRQHFSDLTDPRRRETSYPLMDMVIMALSAVICGADDFVAIAKFVHSKKEWFGTFLDMSKGVPSHDRFNAVFAALRPAEFEKCLLSWITSLHAVTGGQVIAIDGKTLRRSYDKASSKSAIHMVSAWATMNHISLGQVVTDEKSNEITAIPKLLQLIEINGALITIDAMGCQTEIAATIVDLKANYCLAVKRNQPTLHDGIGAHFSKYLDNDFENTKVRRHVSRDTRTRARSGPLQFHLSAAERSSGPKSVLNVRLATDDCQKDLQRQCLRGKAAPKAAELLDEERQQFFRPIPVQTFESHRIVLTDANSLSLVRFDQQ